PGAFPALLKREHRIRWRDYVANALAGFGLVSKSRREFRMLRKLEELGIGSPQAIAVGEDKGRAFLLIREHSDGRDLRKELQRLKPAAHCQSRKLARLLGQAVAAMHARGVAHGDLYSKHVLVRGQPASGLKFCFLDWQRSHIGRRVSWPCRWRDLAA